MNNQKNSKMLVMFLVFFFVFVTAFTQENKKNETNNLTIWYDQPATNQDDAIPLGNGIIGAKIYGNLTNERISLNHEWLWRDRKFRDQTNPEVAHNLPGIRELFFEGKFIEGATAANNLLGSQRIKPELFKPVMNLSGPDPYQPAGDLNITFTDIDKVEGYQRRLDLSTGIMEQTYILNGVNYSRKSFISITDSVLVIHLTADKKKKINCRVNLSRIFDPECEIAPWVDDEGKWIHTEFQTWNDGNKIGFEGKFVENKKFAVMAAISCIGAKSRTFWNSSMPEFRIDEADEAFILISIATDHETNNPLKFCKNQLDRLIDNKSDYASLADSHIKEYQRLFNRVHFSLAGADRSYLPIDQRILQFKSGNADPGLVSLLFNFGRYILMSSSGTGGLPANLYGIWSESLRPSWSSDFHHDINMQHFYWPAEVNNLSECAEPLFDYLDRCIPAAQIAARNLYGCNGIFIPLTTGPWCKCLKTEPGGFDLSKERGGWDEWTGAAAWLSQHYWWHYEFSGDEDFLRNRAYPFIKNVALFYEDFLIEDPRLSSPHKGKLITVPSVSPENSFEGGNLPNSIGIGATSDFELIYEVLTNAIKATKILNIDKDKRLKWSEMLKKIPPLQIGKYGQLQEWLEDYEEPEPGHRHATHLFGIFPDEQISIENTPLLAKAAEITLERRLKNGASTSTLIPTVGVYARLREGDLAEKYIHESRMRFSSGEHAPAASLEISEMLMQSHLDQIRLLPALPAAWANGQISGINARGGFEVDITWNDGKLSETTIHSNNGGLCRMLTNVPVKFKSTNSNIPIINHNSVIVYDFKTKSGEKVKDYSFDFISEAGESYVLIPE